MRWNDKSEIHRAKKVLRQRSETQDNLIMPLGKGTSKHSYVLGDFLIAAFEILIDWNEPKMRRRRQPPLHIAPVKTRQLTPIGI